MKKSYDLVQLEKLADGDKVFVKEMVDLFIENASINLQEMRAAIDNKDFGSVGYLAHKIKPSLDLMGLTSLVKDIKKIETLSKEGTSFDEISDMVLNLEVYCKKVVKELKEDFPD